MLLIMQINELFLRLVLDKRGEGIKNIQIVNTNISVNTATAQKGLISFGIFC